MRVNHRQKFKKVIARRKRAAHKRRVGPVNFYAERVFIVCIICKISKNIKHITPAAGGLGFGPCTTCIKDEKKIAEYKAKIVSQSLEKIEEKKDE